MYRLLKKAAWLGLGEGVARVANFLVLMGVGRFFGVEALGIYGLAQTLVQYIVVGTDLGFKSIGARLVALYPYQSRTVMRSIQSKRMLMLLLLLPVGVSYAVFGPVPSEGRLFIALFVISIVPLVFSIDWLVWGRERFAVLGIWRSATALLYAFLFFSGAYFFETGLLFVSFSNAVSLFIGAVVLWMLLKGLLNDSVSESTAAVHDKIAREVSWSNAWVLGLAFIFNQLFHSVDILMLGALSSTYQLGLYSASYKIIFMILGVYYLLNQAVFPTLVKTGDSSKVRGWIALFLLAVTLVGLLMAVIGDFLAEKILSLIYGKAFGASVPLFQLLLFVLPLDFVVSFLGSLLVAWGNQKLLLIATFSSSVVNILLNFYLIPSYGAMGAVYATLLSYAVILGMLVFYYFTMRNRGGSLANSNEQS